MATYSARRLALAVVTVLALPALVACGGKPGPDKALNAFLAGVNSGDLGGASYVNPTNSALGAAAVAAELNTLFGDLSKIRPTLKTKGKVKTDGDNASATVDVSWPITDKITWTYPTTVRLAKNDDNWRIVWSPATLESHLKTGDKLKLTATNAPRADLRDGKGQPMVTARQVVIVGIVPKNVTNANQLTADLDAAFKAAKVPVDLSKLPSEIANTPPENFLEVVTLRKEVYDSIRSRIHELPGTAFREDVRQLGPVTGFARALIGSVGPATAEQIKNNPGKVIEGDQIGQGGLQAQYDAQLRGGTGVVVTIANAATEADPSVQPVELFRAAPTPGRPLQTTLDAKIQQAADAVLATDKSHTSAIVAMRISDGAILAVANGPDESGQNFALTAQVPPGSTFKMVTAYGVLKGGEVTANTIVNCPKTLTVGGRVFSNAHDFQLGAVPLHTDFAKSCNTAFASLAPKLGGNGLRDAAADLGIGGDWKIGPEVFTGSVGTGGSDIDQAAAAFGQGNTLVSPVAMAVAAATVARGKFLAPSLVKTDAAPPVPGPALTAGALDQLRPMMREVVTGGTAVSLAGLGGEPIFGKTGTAEYDNNPDNTHAWFVGYRGDIAFAVFVEKGGASTETAVPLAGKFLQAID